MAALEALIFDVDGTLAETERDGHRPAFNAAFADVGLGWEWSEALYGELLSVTGGKERIRHYIEHFGAAVPEVPDLDALIKDLHKRKTDHYVRLLRAGFIPLRPGVMRLLREAREAGVRLAIATTTTPQNVTELLASVDEPGLADWFEVIAAGDVVPAKKPAPDIFIYACEHLGLKPDACVAIEDSRNGVRSALAAGLEALLVTLNSYTRDEDMSGAALVVDGLGDPGQPVNALSGALEGPGWIDLSTLRAMHARVYGSAA